METTYTYTLQVQPASSQAAYVIQHHIITAQTWGTISLSSCIMGNLCSKSSTLSGGHTVLGGPGSTANARSDDSEIRRQRIAEAAERRQEAVSTISYQLANTAHRDDFKGPKPRCSTVKPQIRGTIKETSRELNPQKSSSSAKR